MLLAAAAFASALAAVAWVVALVRATTDPDHPPTTRLTLLLAAFLGLALAALAGCGLGARSLSRSAPGAPQPGPAWVVGAALLALGLLAFAAYSGLMAALINEG